MGSCRFGSPRGLREERHNADPRKKLKTEGHPMKLTKLHLALALAGAVLTAPTMAAGPDVWPGGFPTRVKTEAAVMKCCLPKEKVALACKDCKTVTEKSGE